MSQVKRKYKIYEDCFDIIDEEWKAYFLGLFYADGCLTQYSAVISLVDDDRQILEELNKHIHENKPLTFKIKRDFKSPTNHKIYCARPQSALEINNKKINIRLRELGLYERKSLILQFPNDSIIPHNLMAHFIRGYFDGDGCIQNRNKCGQRFDVIGSKDFCQGMSKWLFNNLNIKCFTKPNGKVDRLYVYDKKDMATLYHFLYDKSSIYLHRKYDVFKEIINSFDWTEINKEKYSTSKYVTYDKRRSHWIVNKKINGNPKFYGSFLKEDDAINLAKTLY